MLNQKEGPLVFQGNESIEEPAGEQAADYSIDKLSLKSA